MKLNATAMALAAGVFWSVVLFAWTLMAVQYGYGVEMLNLLTIYPGYEVSVQGAVLGLFWGFLDASIGTLIFVWLYNLFVDKLGAKK